MRKSQYTSRSPRRRYFYESVAGLDELLGALFDRTRDELTLTARTASHQAPADLFERVRAGIAAPFRYLAADPRRIQLLLIDAPACPALSCR
ncbi:MAG: hypothetical protein ACRDUS_04535 [Mycobacterium sp.]